MDVKSGYKLTEVGVIPEEWQVRLLWELLEDGPQSGYSGRSSKDAKGTATLSLSATSSGRIVLDDSTIKWLLEEIPESSDLFLQAGDVLVQRSNTIDLVGTTAIYLGPPSQFVYPDLMMRLRFRDSSTAQFFWRYANSAAGRRVFRAMAAGSTGSMPKISRDRLRGMQVPLPPLQERAAIAAASADIDLVIDGLERLFAKKRDLKQAAMQQLLTGQTRLSGFQGEWETTQVRSVIADYFSGPSPTCEERNIQGDDEWGVLKTTAATQENGWDWTKHKALPRAYWNKREIELRPGDVIVTKAGPRHRVGVAAWVGHVPPRIIPSGKMIALRPRSAAVTPLMLAAAISARAAQTYLDQRTTGMAESQVNFENEALLDAPIVLPSIDEQRAITAVLSDMDAELSALEARRDKTRALRDAMMQELLTGRTRLV